MFYLDIKEPINIHEDNSGAINIANYGNFTKNSKHIEIHYHYVHESVSEKEIKIVKIESNENVADIFTKALCKEKFEKLREFVKCNIIKIKHSQVHSYNSPSKMIDVK